jgi:pilus assembly protein CpaC
MCHSAMLHRVTHKLTKSVLCLLIAGICTPTCLVRAQNNGTLTNSVYEIRQPHQQFEMIVKSGRILTLDAVIDKFYEHNKEILTVEPLARNQVQIFAKAPGATQVDFWDLNNKRYTVDIVIVADSRMIESILSHQLPYANLKVTPIGEGAIVSGTVTSVEDVATAVAITEQFYPTVVNNVRVVGVQQVILRTRIMEVSRTKLRNLGIDWQLSGQTINWSSTVGGVQSSGLVTNALVGDNFQAFIDAMRRDGLIKLLAEPNVVATHGRPARFNVGGRVPYIVPQGVGTVSVEYEEFGTSVDFLPFVIGPGRLKLEVRPEVSEPDASKGIVANGVNITGFTNRYVDTSVEMQSGQTFAIAGLLQSRVETQVSKTPFFGELPYFGTLFRKTREQQNEVELLITVTPDFAEAMDAFEVPCGGPGLNTRTPTDKELFLKGYAEVPNVYGDCPPGQQKPGFHGGPELIHPTETPVYVGNGISVANPRN